MDVMREFAVVTKMGSTGVKDAALTKVANALPIRLNVKMGRGWKYSEN